MAHLRSPARLATYVRLSAEDETGSRIESLARTADLGCNIHRGGSIAGIEEMIDMSLGRNLGLNDPTPTAWATSLARSQVSLTN